MTKARRTSMRNFVAAIAILAISGGSTVVWADDSGHADPQSLKAEQSHHDGTLGKTTEGRTAGDAATTPGAGHIDGTLSDRRDRTEKSIGLSEATSASGSRSLRAASRRLAFAPRANKPQKDI